MAHQNSHNKGHHKPSSDSNLFGASEYFDLAFGIVIDFILIGRRKFGNGMDGRISKGL